MRMDKNGEGYADPTAGAAYRNIKHKEYQEEAERLEKIGNLIPVLRSAAAMVGFDIIGRIPLRDKETGKEYR